MICRSNDPLADFDRYDAEEYAFAQKCPVCDICGEPITDDYYCQAGTLIFHESCMEHHSVDGYVEGLRYGV